MASKLPWSEAKWLEWGRDHGVSEEVIRALMASLARNSERPQPGPNSPALLSREKRVENVL